LIHGESHRRDFFRGDSYSRVNLAEAYRTSVAVGKCLPFAYLYTDGLLTEKDEFILRQLRSALRFDVIRRVAEFISLTQARKRENRNTGRVLFGFTGFDCSGKSYFSGTELARCLQWQGRDVVVVMADWSMVDEETRLADPDKYSIYENWFPYEETLIQWLTKLVDPQISELPLTNLYVYVDGKGKRVHSETLRVGDDTIILVDGLFLQRPQVRRFLDEVVYFDITEEESLRRQLERDPVKMRRTPEQVRHLVRDIFLSAHRRYIAEVDPMADADMVVDNNDFNNPWIVKEGVISSPAQQEGPKNRNVPALFTNNETEVIFAGVNPNEIRPKNRQILHRLLLLWAEIARLPSIEEVRLSYVEKNRMELAVNTSWPVWRLTEVTYLFKRHKKELMIFGLHTKFSACGDYNPRGLLLLLFLLWNYHADRVVILDSLGCHGGVGQIESYHALSREGILTSGHDISGRLTHDNVVKDNLTKLLVSDERLRAFIMGNRRVSSPIYGMQQEANISPDFSRGVGCKRIKMLLSRDEMQELRGRSAGYLLQLFDDQTSENEFRRQAAILLLCVSEDYENSLSAIGQSLQDRSNYVKELAAIALTRFDCEEVINLLKDYVCRVIRFKNFHCATAGILAIGCVGCGNVSLRGYSEEALNWLESDVREKGHDLRWYLQDISVAKKFLDLEDDTFSGISLRMGKGDTSKAAIKKEAKRICKIISVVEATKRKDYTLEFIEMVLLLHADGLFKVLRSYIGDDWGGRRKDGSSPAQETKNARRTTQNAPAVGGSAFGGSSPAGVGKEEIYVGNDHIGFVDFAAGRIQVINYQGRGTDGIVVNKGIDVPVMFEFHTGGCVVMCCFAKDSSGAIIGSFGSATHWGRIIHMETSAGIVKVSYLGVEWNHSPLPEYWHRVMPAYALKAANITKTREFSIFKSSSPVKNALVPAISRGIAVGQTKGLFRINHNTGRRHLRRYPKLIIGNEADLELGSRVVLESEEFNERHAGLTYDVLMPELRAGVVDNHTVQFLMIKLAYALGFLEGSGKTLIHVDTAHHWDLNGINHFRDYHPDSPFREQIRYFSEVLDAQSDFGIESHITPLVLDGTFTRVIQVTGNLQPEIEARIVYVVAGDEKRGRFIRDLAYPETTLAHQLKIGKDPLILLRIPMVSVPLNKLAGYLVGIPVCDRVLGFDVDSCVSQRGEIVDERGFKFWQDTPLEFAFSCFSTSPGFAEQDQAIKFCKVMLESWRRKIKRANTGGNSFSPRVETISSPIPVCCQGRGTVGAVVGMISSPAQKAPQSARRITHNASASSPANMRNNLGSFLASLFKGHVLLSVDFPVSYLGREDKKARLDLLQEQIFSACDRIREEIAALGYGRELAKDIFAVLGNCIDNAFDATFMRADEEGFGSIMGKFVTFQVCYDEYHGTLNFIIVDHGSGIQRDTFEAWEQQHFFTTKFYALVWGSLGEGVAIALKRALYCQFSVRFFHGPACEFYQDSAGLLSTVAAKKEDTGTTVVLSVNYVDAGRTPPTVGALSPLLEEAKFSSPAVPYCPIRMQRVSEAAVRNEFTLASDAGADGQRYIEEVINETRAVLGRMDEQIAATLERLVHSLVIRAGPFTSIQTAFDNGILYCRQALLQDREHTRI
ncbi:MAG: hypothetical protein WC394_03240, partial [Candidatus Omnitrophota bacterium]